jgi:assimilatory nitrate reductase catalytic subunit
MNLKRLLGIDTLAEKYSYGHDPRFGYTAAAKIPDHWIPTTCGYCSVGCGLEIGVKDGRAVTVRGMEQHPVNLGKLCPKGLAEHQTIDVESRAKQPLLRKNGRLEPVSWDEALDRMIAEFQKVQQAYGRGALGVVSTGQLVTEEFYALGKLVQLGFGTNNYDGNTTLCMASAVAGYKRSFGSDGPPGAYDDLEVADVVFLIGANIADNHPILCYRLERNPKTKLIVADPRVSKTARMADLHLPVKPRSDIALINGMAHILIRAGLIDRDYIDAHTNGFAELEQHLEKYTPERVAQVTGLSEEMLYRAALLYGRAQAPFIGWTMGVNHSTQGAETVNAINNLALITGNVGKAGASPFSITGQCNAMGTREIGFTSSLPGYRRFNDANDGEKLACLWNIDPSELPTERGQTYPDIVEACVKARSIPSRGSRTTSSPRFA